MTDKEINRVIAEHQGWTHFEEGPYDGRLFGIRPGDSCPSHKYAVPDFASDLNEMHAVEEQLDEKGCHRYFACLCDIVESNPNYKECIGYIHATARQRAEAFLRTIGKWNEQ